MPHVSLHPCPEESLAPLTTPPHHKNSRAWLAGFQSEGFLLPFHRSLLTARDALSCPACPAPRL